MSLSSSPPHPTSSPLYPPLADSASALDWPPPDPLSGPLRSISDWEWREEETGPVASEWQEPPLLDPTRLTSQLDWREEEMESHSSLWSAAVASPADASPVPLPLQPPPSLPCNPTLSSSHSASVAPSTSSYPPPEDRPRFWSRKVACQVCHFAKARCDGGRPCSRCMRLSHTAHCIDRPSRRPPRASLPTQGKRQCVARDEANDGGSEDVSRRKEELEPHAPLPVIRSLRLPVELSCAAMDASLVSRTLVASAHRCVAKQRSGELAMPVSGMRRLTLRDKLLAWTWQHAMMTAEDAESFIHSFFAGQSTWHVGVFEGRHSPLITAAVSALIGAQDSVGHAVLRRPRQRHVCDGTACYGYCPWMEALAASAGCLHSWQRSPLVAVPDAVNAPNQPFLVIQRLFDDRAAEVQEKEVEAISLRVAAQLLSARQRLPLPLDAACGGDSDSSSAASQQLDVDTADVLPLPQSYSPPPHCDDWSSSSPSRHGSPQSRGAAIEVVAVVQANAAFERLLEWRQDELRQLFCSEGERAFYRLFREESWPQLMDLDAEVKWARREEWRVYATCRSRRQRDVPCLLHGQHRFDEEGKPRVSFLSFIPLPDERSGPLAWGAGAG